MEEAKNMLVLSRRRGEAVVIGDVVQVRVIVLAVDGRGRVKLGFQAPHEVPIYRAELRPLLTSDTHTMSMLAKCHKCGKIASEWHDNAGLAVCMECHSAA